MNKIRALRSVSTAGMVLEALDGDGTGWSWRRSMVMDSVGDDRWSLIELNGTEWSWMEPNGANAAGARAAKKLILISGTLLSFEVTGSTMRVIQLVRTISNEVSELIIWYVQVSEQSFT